MLATTEKRTLTLTDLDAEAGFVLPARETMLVTIVITRLIDDVSINVEVKNNNVAVQICAVVSAVASFLNTPLSCEVQQ
jgi:hypothetical protein